jgi:hypothetical protein
MYASEKYMLDVIKIECKQFLTTNINEKYACLVLHTAHDFHLEDLQKDALQFIFSHGRSCLESIIFLGLSLGIVKLIIESDKLNCTEDIVYQKLIQWAEHQCRKDQQVTADDEQHVTGNEDQHVTTNDEQHVTANSEQQVTGNDEQHVTDDEEQHVSGVAEQHVTANDEQHVTDDEEQHVSGVEEQHVTANDEQHVTDDEEQHVSGVEEQHVTANDEQHVTAISEQHVIVNDGRRVTANAEHHVTGNDAQLRKALEDLIYLIRFPIMERKYFSNEVCTRNVLTAEEKVEIFLSFDGKQIYTFPANMRLPISKLEVWRCESNLNTSEPWDHNGEDDCLDFTTNFDCSIVGINVFGSTQYSGHHEVNINILNGSTHLGSTRTKLKHVPGKQLYPLDLAEPIRILKNIAYTIKLNMKGNSCFRGKDYKTVVKIDDGSTVTFTDSESSKNGTNSTTGQIPGIILSRHYVR